MGEKFIFLTDCFLERTENYNSAFFRNVKTFNKSRKTIKLELIKADKVYFFSRRSDAEIRGYLQKGILFKGTLEFKYIPHNGRNIVSLMDRTIEKLVIEEPFFEESIIKIPIINERILPSIRAINSDCINPFVWDDQPFFIPPEGTGDTTILELMGESP